MLFVLTATIALLAGTNLSVSRNFKERNKKGKVRTMSCIQKFSGRSAATAALAAISSYFATGAAETGSRAC